MHSKSTGTTTKADRRRFDILREIGCIVCLTFHDRHSEIQTHHPTACGFRIGPKGHKHAYTIGLCPQHHEAVNRKWFRAMYGGNDELLEIQETEIDKKLALSVGGTAPSRPEPLQSKILRRVA